MIKSTCFLAVCLLAANVLAQTNASTAAMKPEISTNGLNDNLVTPDGKPIGIRITVGHVPDYLQAKDVKPGTARIVTEDAQELKAFALTEGDNAGAVVGYYYEDKVMVREQTGNRLGRVFSPRYREKVKSVSERTRDGNWVTRTTYDGRPATEAELFVFLRLNWGDE